jgi:hypothetical protein
MSDQQPKQGRNPWMIVAIVLAVLAAVLVGVIAVKAATSSEPAAIVVPNSGDTSPSNPEVGKKDEVRPVILGGIDSWQDVKRYSAKHPWYKEPLTAAGISMSAVKRSASKPAQYAKVVLVSNTTISNQQARQQLARKGYPACVSWPVVRVSGFWNTALDESGSWSKFIDIRSQVRATLLPVNSDGSLNATHGVLLHCGNSWWFLNESENPISGAHPKPRPSLEPKKWWLIAHEPPPPKAKAPEPIGTAAPFASLAPSDPAPDDVIDVNPPAKPAVPDSGSGATNTASPAPVLTASPAPAPSASASPGIIVPSD